MRALLGHVLRHWRSYFWGFVTLAIVDFIGACVLTWLLGVPFEKGDGLERIFHVHADSAAGRCAWVAILYVGFAVLQAGLRYGWRYFFMGGAQRVSFEVREDLFKKLQQLPIAYFDRAKTGDLMSRATNDLEAVTAALGMGALLAADSLCYFVMVPIFLYRISPHLMLITLFCLPPVPLLIYKLGQVVHLRSKVVQDVFGVLSARLQETFSGIRVVQAFAQEDRESDRFEKVGRDYLGGQRALSRIQSLFNPTFEWFFDAVLAVVLLFGGREVLAGKLDLADLVRFARALDQLVWPMMAVGWLTNVVQRGVAGHERILEILRQAEDPAFALLPATVPATPALQGAVAARHLTFRYPSVDAARPPVLEDVSFEVPEGALVAIVGPVASGKSTLLSLITRLYDPPRGALFLDGRDVLDVPLADLRRGVAIVPQDTFLFSATIEENVKLGRSDLDHEAVVRAARAAQVDGEVRGVPGGYGALLGERGVNLSGGQRQRLAIARALVRTPRVLILDDSLSAVDTATESALFQEIRAIQKDGRPPTRLVATHRLAIARAADLVIVLEKGRVVALGTHAELVARGGLYARLARRDALAEELARA